MEFLFHSHEKICYIFHILSSCASIDETILGISLFFWYMLFRMMKNHEKRSEKKVQQVIDLKWIKSILSDGFDLFVSRYPKIVQIDRNIFEDLKRILYQEENSLSFLSSRFRAALRFICNLTDTQQHCLISELIIDLAVPEIQFDVYYLH